MAFLQSDFLPNEKNFVSLLFNKVPYFFLIILFITNYYNLLLLMLLLSFLQNLTLVLIELILSHYHYYLNSNEYIFYL